MQDNKEKGKEHNRLNSKDILAVLFLLSVAVYSIYLFRSDLLNTIKLQNVEPVGLVVIKKNTVQRRISDRLIWDRLAKESPVYLGDLIRIANQSEAYLKINNNTIELYENSLVRIIASPDGEGIMLQISSGTVSVVQEEGGEPMYVEINGQPVKTQPGIVLTATVTEAGDAVVNELEVSEWEEINTNITAQINENKIELISPAVNALFGYQDEIPLVQFRWEENEEAVSYAIEISNSHDFNGFHTNINTSGTSFVTRLNEGTWYWRVKPVYPLHKAGRSFYSSTAFFRVIKTGPEDKPSESLSFSDWLAAESPVNQEVPPDVPKEIIPPAILAVLEPPPPPPPPPPPIRPAPVRTLPARTPPPPRPQVPQPLPPAPTPIVPLTAPANLIPVNNTTLGIEHLRSRRSINFTWDAVQGANAYLFSLFLATDDGYKQIIRTNPITATNYTVNNLRDLERGSFVWRVEAVFTDDDGTIQRRGTMAENTFNIDFPSPTPIKIQDTGVLYGE